MDFGTSSDPRVQAQLDRLATLSLPQGRFGLGTMRALMARLGDPQGYLPPVFHVAGTNGKGSTCAFLRAMLEADGKCVHVAISPHLVRYNERIVVAGEEITDGSLADLLCEVLDAADRLYGAESLAPSFFEATVAASFLAFARTPADACVIEVGLGGRFDATNVIEHPAMCGIAALGIDHERFLLAPEDGVPQTPIARIAFEKAGIVKQGRPVVTQSQTPDAAREIGRAASAAGAPLAMQGVDWHVSTTATGLHYEDRHGALALPLPALAGPHQVQNAGLAMAMLRHQDAVSASRDSIATGLRTARWPGRLQRLPDGMFGTNRALWLDGGHNRNAGEALAAHLAGTRLHLVLGMLEAKDPAALVAPLGDSIASLTIVPVPGHEAHPASAFGAEARRAPDVALALAALPDDGLPVLVAGSLYLAGSVLREAGAMPGGAA
ncbi:MAG: bifunctional folylpolyglutamate synthase/dihydrofolate synthase [Parerythrobacter sp.]